MLDDLGAIERHIEEEPQRRDGGVDLWRTRAARRQMQPKAAHVFRLSRVGRAAEERRKTLDPLNVVVLRLRREIARAGRSSGSGCGRRWRRLRPPRPVPDRLPARIVALAAGPSRAWPRAIPMRCAPLSSSPASPLSSPPAFEWQGVVLPANFRVDAVGHAAGLDRQAADHSHQAAGEGAGRAAAQSRARRPRPFAGHHRGRCADARAGQIQDRGRHLSRAALDLLVAGARQERRRPARGSGAAVVDGGRPGGRRFFRSAGGPAQRRGGAAQRARPRRSPSPKQITKACIIYWTNEARRSRSLGQGQFVRTNVEQRSCSRKDRRRL